MAPGTSQQQPAAAAAAASPGLEELTGPQRQQEGAPAGPAPDHPSLNAPGFGCSFSQGRGQAGAGPGPRPAQRGGTVLLPAHARGLAQQAKAPPLPGAGRLPAVAASNSHVPAAAAAAAEEDGWPVTRPSALPPSHVPQPQIVLAAAPAAMLPPPARPPPPALCHVPVPTASLEALMSVVGMGAPPVRAQGGGVAGQQAATTTTTQPPAKRQRREGVAATPQPSPGACPAAAAAPPQPPLACLPAAQLAAVRQLQAAVQAGRGLQRQLEGLPDVQLGHRTAVTTLESLRQPGLQQRPGRTAGGGHGPAAVAGADLQGGVVAAAAAESISCSVQMPRSCAAVMLKGPAVPAWLGRMLAPISCGGGPMASATAAAAPCASPACVDDCSGHQDLAALFRRRAKAALSRHGGTEAATAGAATAQGHGGGDSDDDDDDGDADDAVDETDAYMSSDALQCLVGLAATQPGYGWRMPVCVRDRCTAAAAAAAAEEGPQPGVVRAPLLFFGRPELGAEGLQLSCWQQLCREQLLQVPLPDAAAGGGMAASSTGTGTDTAEPAAVGQGAVGFDAMDTDSCPVAAGGAGQGCCAVVAADGDGSSGECCSCQHSTLSVGQQQHKVYVVSHAHVGVPDASATAGLRPVLLQFSPCSGSRQTDATAGAAGRAPRPGLAEAEAMAAAAAAGDAGVVAANAAAAWTAASLWPEALVVVSHRGRPTNPKPLHVVARRRVGAAPVPCNNAHC